MSQKYNLGKRQQERYAEKFDEAFKKMSFGQTKHQIADKKPKKYEQANSQPSFLAKQQKADASICDLARLQYMVDSNYQYFNDFSYIDQVLPSGINHHQPSFQQWEEYTFPGQSSPKQIEKEKQQQLKKFQTSKISISRLISESKIGKSNIPSQNKQENLIQPKIEVSKYEQELECIPCPFCALPLQLIQLDHINACPQGTECFYCKQKYPKSLYGSHLVICQKRETYYAKDQKKSQPSQKKQPYNAALPKQQKIKKQQENPRPPQRKIFERPKPSKNIGSIQRRQVPIVKKASKEAQKKQQQPRIDLIALDNASKLRKQELKGLYNWQIQQIATQVYEKNGKQSQVECAICTGEAQEGQVIMRLPCNHCFHEDCLIPWLQTRSRCPTCKTRIIQ